jgi:hypothetical protein
MIGLVFAPPAARARVMGVDIWTDRGKDAIYEPGDPLEIKVRASDDAYLLVYDIDSQGYIRVLYPYEGNSGFIEGRRTYHVPPASSDAQLVVQGPVGEGYVVALASREPFSPLPWYLRPYDPQAEGAGYVGAEDEQEDVTKDGQIMGDPFVAMERIRRKVIENPNNESAFATAYTSYYVHEPVRYPRYLCNECHRPGYWAWWDGWDPYYTTCSAFDFRVYWGWNWGPRYWFGSVPYFCYVPRCYPCAPYDRPWYSSWNGQRQWNTLWSGHLQRFKSPPPPGYTPPSRFGWSRGGGGRPLPPGFLPADYARGPRGERVRVPIGANRPNIEEPGTHARSGEGLRPGPANRPRAIPGPAGRSGDEGGVRYIRPNHDARPLPGGTPRGHDPQSTPRNWRPNGEPRPAPTPRNEHQGGESRPAPAPQYEHHGSDSHPAPAHAPAPQSSPSRGGGDKGGGERHGRR